MSAHDDDVEAARSTSTDLRRGRRERSDALCCACGAIRQVATTYVSRPPAEVERPADARSVQYLKCSGACGTRTWHALLLPPERRDKRGDACEMQNRRADQSRARVRRRLAGMQAIGVAVIRKSTFAQMQLDDAVVEIVQYDARVEVRLCEAADPREQVKAIETLEELLDDLELLGEWTMTKTCRWRGVAIRQRVPRNPQ